MAEVRVAKVNTARTLANPNLKAKAVRDSPMRPALIPARDKVMVRTSVNIGRAANGTSVSVSRIASATSRVTARKAKDIPVMPRSRASRYPNVRWAHRSLLKASWK